MSKADWLRLSVLSLLWGGSFLFVGLALAGGAPSLVLVLVLVWCRVGFGAAVLAAVLLLMRTELPQRQLWPALSVMGLRNNTVPYTLFAFAQGEIGAGLAAILNATTPLFTVVAGHLVLSEDRMTGPQVAGVVPGFAGVLVMMRGEAFGATGLGHGSGARVWPSSPVRGPRCPMLLPGSGDGGSSGLACPPWPLLSGNARRLR